MSALGLLPDIAAVRLSWGLIYAEGMCGRVIQSSAPLSLAIVVGVDVKARDLVRDNAAVRAELQQRFTH